MSDLLQFDWNVSPIVQWISLVVGTFVSEDATLLAGVAAVHQQLLSTTVLLSGYMFGVLLGDVGLYYIGYGLSAGPSTKMHALAERFVKWIRLHPKIASQHRLDTILLVCRFVPGSRLPTYLTAGFVRYPIFRFVAILVTPTFVLAIITLYASHLLARWLPDGIWGSIMVSVLAFAISLSLIRVILFVYKHRRHLGIALQMQWYKVAKWHKAEFWPPWLFYFPVSFIFVAMFIKHRLPTAFLFANPSMSNSGLIGESKVDIEELLERAAPLHHLKSTLIGADLPMDDKAEKLSLFMKLSYLTWPIILKPDFGQRGQGVQIIDSEQQAHRYLAEAHYDVLAQEYCEWKNELGIFYYRLPDQDHGQILSVTKKEFPKIVGDGRRTFAELVLADKRARYVAAVYARRWADFWHVIIPQGTVYTLVECGNHAQGAIFEDGRHCISERVVAEIDDIATRIPGFFVGRFDVRYETDDNFKEKAQFRIVELNGAGAESTDVYDPNYSLLKIYRRLYQQWDCIYTVGKQLAPRTGRWRAALRFLRDLFSQLRRFKRYPLSS